MDGTLKIGVIGGGAAGFFSALSVARHHPDAHVEILEKTSKLLSKVRISGGGRCNVTNACFIKSQFAKNYPRGGKQLKKAINQFSTEDTVDWFESRGVKLKAEADNRMFPVTDSSSTIIDCLMREVEKTGVVIRTGRAVKEIKPFDGGVMLGGVRYDKVIIATGGSPKLSGFDSIKTLMGLVVQDANVRIQGSKLSYRGPVLVTHWGLSGPAVLKLSAWGARLLEESGYEFKIQVNWTQASNEEEVHQVIDEVMEEIRKKKIVNACPFDLPKKFWCFLLEKVGVDPDSQWLELGKKSRNKLVNVLFNDVYEVKGKTTFKEEFVTCGGVTLGEVDFKTMESRVCPNLYFAGEVLDVDGITGGFNFQAAWTTGFIAGRLG